MKFSRDNTCASTSCHVVAQLNRFVAPLGSQTGSVALNLVLHLHEIGIPMLQ